MQTMPAFLRNKRGVLIGHPASLIRKYSRSSGVAAFVSNVEARRSPRRAPLQRNLRRRCLRLRQMRHAVFLTVARDAKIEIRIGQLRGAAHRATMQRFVVAARVCFETSPPRRDFMAMSRLVNDFRAEKDEVIGES